MGAATLNSSSILSKLKLSGKLPTPKGIALEVINLSQRDDVSNQVIAHLIGADPALSLRVIKTANVLCASPTRPIVTVSDAVTVLGLRSLRQLVLGITLIADHKNGPCKQFDYPAFWTRSLLTGIAVKQFAEQSKLAASEEVFTLGLLGDMGKLAMATVFPEEFGVILENSKDCSLDQLYGMEREQFGFEQAELTAAILADMNFPPIFLRLIHDYPQPQNSSVAEGTREWKLMNMLHLAARVADVYLAAPLQQEMLVSELWSYYQSLEIEEVNIVSVIEQCSQDWPEWANLLNMDTRQLPSLQELFSRMDN